MHFPDLVPHALVMLTKRGVAVIGEREARLLEAVDRVRSIKDAASEAGISYRQPGARFNSWKRPSAAPWSCRGRAARGAGRPPSPRNAGSSSRSIGTCGAHSTKT